jgi:hypothetical protein
LTYIAITEYPCDTDFVVDSDLLLLLCRVTNEVSTLKRNVMESKAFFGADSLIYIVLGEAVFTGAAPKCIRPAEPVDVYLNDAVIGTATLNECDHFSCWVEPGVLAGMRGKQVTPEIICKRSPAHPQRQEVSRIVLHSTD